MRILDSCQSHVTDETLAVLSLSLSLYLDLYLDLYLYLYRRLSFRLITLNSLSLSLSLYYSLLMSLSHPRIDKERQAAPQQREGRRECNNRPLDTRHER